MQGKNEYRKSIDDYKAALPVKRRIKLYWCLAIFRIFLTILPQTGYIHPDEYFQTIEVIAGDRFDVDVRRPWEFNSTFPIRSVFLSQFTVGIPYSLLKNLSVHTLHLCGLTLIRPYFLVVLPRLAMCALSFLSDYCLYKICCMCGQNYKTRLIAFASSYVILTYATRVFSNSIEIVLVSLLLYYVSSSMTYSEKVVIQSDCLSEKYDKAISGAERVKYYKLLMSLPTHSLNHCIEISTITVIGTFNRPTFLAFAFAPIFFWLQRGIGSRKIGLLDFHVRIFAFVLCTIPTTIFFILYDSFYFGYLTMGEIGKFDIGMKNFVVTPVNFIKYNVKPTNLKNHGLHPRFLHLFVNVPLLYNVLGIVGLYALGKMLCSGLKGKWLGLPRIQSMVGLMTASFVVPIALLSIFPHQEPRFLIPVIFPLVFLHAPTLARVPGVDIVQPRVEGSAPCPSLHERTKLTKLQIVWYLCNLLSCLFYGFLHQGGVFPLASHIALELKSKPHLTHVHLYTSYTYSMPTALLQLRNTRKTYMSSDGRKYRLARDFYLYEQGSKDLTEVHDSLLHTIEECEKKLLEKKIPYRLYYALPASALDDFVHHYYANKSCALNYQIVATFYPHISTEKLPTLTHHFSSINYAQPFSISTMHMLNDVFSYLQQFKLTLVKIEKTRTAFT